MSSSTLRLSRNPITHSRAFWAMAAIAVTFPAISAVPSPLYSLYQDLWGFSDTVLTEVFAIYVVALLVSLLVFGALSDHVGRRPVLLGAILLEAVSLVLFLVAGGVATLAVARVVATPGQVIQWRGGRPVIDGRRLDQEAITDLAQYRRFADAVIARL